MMSTIKSNYRARRPSTLPFFVPERMTPREPRQMAGGWVGRSGRGFGLTSGVDRGPHMAGGKNGGSLTSDWMGARCLLALVRLFHFFCRRWGGRRWWPRRWPRKPLRHPVGAITKTVLLERLVGLLFGDESDSNVRYLRPVLIPAARELFIRSHRANTTGLPLRASLPLGKRANFHLPPV